MFEGWIALSTGEIIIHWITQLVLLVFIHWIVIYPVDSIIHLLNNRGLVLDRVKSTSVTFRRERVKTDRQFFRCCQPGEIRPKMREIRSTQISKRVMKCPLWNSFPQIQHHSSLGTKTIKVIKCPPNVVPQVNINRCIYNKLKLTLTFTLTLLLETSSKGLDLKGHFVLDVKIGHASNFVLFVPWLNQGLTKPPFKSLAILRT